MRFPWKAPIVVLVGGLKEEFCKQGLKAALLTLVEGGEAFVLSSTGPPVEEFRFSFKIFLAGGFPGFEPQKKQRVESGGAGSAS